MGLSLWEVPFTAGVAFEVRKVRRKFIRRLQVGQLTPFTSVPDRRFRRA
jgi:hypothetical protein